VTTDKKATIEVDALTITGGSWTMEEIRILMDAHAFVFPGAQAVLQVGRKSRKSEQIQTGL